MSPRYPAALPIAHTALRILIVVSWLLGAAILMLLVCSLAFEQWTFTALGVPPSAETRALIAGMRAIAALGLAAVALNRSVFLRLLAIVESVREGEPFVEANADRLQAVAWLLLALQVLSVAIGSIAHGVSSPHHSLHLAAGFSTSGWLAVVLTFVLARVFAEGTRMREDLEGTV